MKENIKVICDTNIWYNLANGTIDSKELQNIDLIATEINIRELASTPNLISNINLVKSAFKQLHENHTKIIKTYPFEYMINYFDNDFKPDTQIVEKWLDNFMALLQINDIHKFDLLEAKMEINNLVNDKKEHATDINELLVPIKQEIRNKHRKKTYREKRFIDKWKKVFSKGIVDYMKIHYNKELSISLEDENWKYFDFFLLSWEEYFKKLEIEPRKYDKNDWEDLLNLIYVLPEYKYWTSENKWNEMFNKSDNLKKYLFIPNVR